MSINGDAADLKLLIRKRGNVKQRLTSFMNFFSPIQQAFDQQMKIGEKKVNELQIRIEKLALVFDEYEEVQSSIELTCEEIDVDIHYKQRDDFTLHHTECMASARVLLDKLQPKSESVSEHNGSGHGSVYGSMQGTVPYNLNMNLPPIKIPVFNCDYNKWLEYKETFESLIHQNNSLNEIQKFHYLRASLGDNAIKVIQSLEFSAKNYLEAWDLLCKRFDNSRLLVNNHLKSIVNLESLTRESVIGLRNMIDSVNKHLRALKSLGLPTEHWDAWLIYLISIKLDKGTSRGWEQHYNGKELPKFDAFLNFLSNRADFLETLEVKHQIKNESKGSKASYSFIGNETKYKCFFCAKNHLIYNCNQFIALTVSDRWQKLKELNLCSNCLCKGHISRNCRYYPCKKCKLKHHVLLHKNFNNENKVQNKSNNEVNSPAQSNNESIVSVTLSSQSDKRDYVLLSTAEVLVYDFEGQVCTARVVLDSGSQSCFISERLCKKLRLQVSNTDVEVVGINNGLSSIRSKCDVVIKSKQNNFSLSLSCLVLPKITGNLPIYDIDTSHWNIPPNIRLADANFFVSNKVDLLIGAKHFWNILRNGKINLGKNLPVLQNTVFGYIISGNVNQDRGNTVSNSLFVMNEAIHEDIMKFRNIEETNLDLSLSEEDSICEKHFLNNHYCNKDGRFVVKIPFKCPPTEVGDTKSISVKRFLNLERKFANNSQFKEAYKLFMNEYRDLGHMELKKNDGEHFDMSCFLPHHGVIREESLSTKLRVVFDGSLVSSSGKSINQIQYKRPPTQNDSF